MPYYIFTLLYILAYTQKSLLFYARTCISEQREVLNFFSTTLFIINPVMLTIVIRNILSHKRWSLYDMLVRYTYTGCTRTIRRNALYRRMLHGAGLGVMMGIMVSVLMDATLTGNTWLKYMYAVCTAIDYTYVVIVNLLAGAIILQLLRSHIRELRSIQMTVLELRKKIAVDVDVEIEIKLLKQRVYDARVSLHRTSHTLSPLMVAIYVVTLCGVAVTSVSILWAMCGLSGYTPTIIRIIFPVTLTMHNIMIFRGVSRVVVEFSKIPVLLGDILSVSR